MTSHDNAYRALECSFCFDTFTDPVVLQCGHSQCRDCVQQQAALLLVGRHAPAAGKGGCGSGGEDARAGAPLAVACATCNQPTAVTLSADSKTVTNLPANRDLTESLRALESAAVAAAPPTATTSTTTTKHACPHHAGEDIRLWCTDCSVLVCVLCIIDKHGGHAVKGIDDAVAAERGAVAAYATGAGAAIAKNLGAVVNAATDELARVALHNGDAAAAIRDEFAALAAALCTRRDALLQECALMHDEKAKLLRQQRDVANDALAQARLLSHHTDECSQARDPIVVLRACARMRSKLAQHLAGFGQGPPQTLVCSAVDVSVKCEPAAVTQAIAAMGTVLDARAAAAKQPKKHKHKRKPQVPVGPRPSIPTRQVHWNPSGGSRRGANFTNDALFAPKGVALEPRTGHVFVAEERGEIVVFDESCKRLRRFGAPGAAPGQLSKPGGIAFTREGNLVVADTGNHRVSMMTNIGAPITTFGDSRGGTEYLNEPLYVAVNEANQHIFVSDYKCGQVVELSPDMQALRRHAFAAPTGLMVRDNVLYVAERDTGIVKTMDTKSRCWGTVTRRLDMPSGLDMDSTGGVVVVNNAGRQLVSISKDTHTVATMGNLDVDSRDRRCLLSFDIAISMDNTMLVTNTAHSSLSVFSPV